MRSRNKIIKEGGPAPPTIIADLLIMIPTIHTGPVVRFILTFIDVKG